MNRRERVSVSIPFFGIRFSAVLYITNAPSIQMIQQLLGRLALSYTSFMTCGFWPWSIAPPSPPPPPCYTTSFWNIIYYHNLHSSFKGSRVTGGGAVSYKKKVWNPCIFFQRNALMDIKISIIDICYAYTAPIPKTLMCFYWHPMPLGRAGSKCRTFFLRKKTRDFLPYNILILLPPVFRAEFGTLDPFPI